MAVLGRLIVASAERIDLPDFLSLDSYVAGDFKYLLKGLVGDDVPYILKGFDVINPQDAIGSQNISVRIADSVVFYPGADAGSFYHGFPEGDTYAQPLVPELRKSATNYVYLTFDTFQTSRDTRAFWDPDLDGGDGGEFTQDIDTQTVLTVRVNVSVASFPENTLPICKVNVGPTVIESIEDARHMLFRLAPGGINPDPFKRYTFRSEPSAGFERTEPSNVMNTALDPNPFRGADKNFNNLKEWMDVVMTKLAELGGTTYWYEQSSSDLTNVFNDALGTSIKSKGSWQHDSSIPGKVTWTEDIVIKNLTDDREVIIRGGEKTLANEEVAYIQLVRDEEINNADIAVNWINGADYVNGPVNSFENLSKGDWIKKKNDPSYIYRRVEEFYADINKGGGITTPSLARSIALSATYLGTTQIMRAVYTKGVYDSTTEVLASPRNDGTLKNLGDNFSWLAIRTDTIMNIASIETTTLTLNIIEGDGTTAKCVETILPNHGLVDGDRITINAGPHAGTWTVEADGDQVFYIASTSMDEEFGRTAYYATVTTTTRSTPNNLQLESEKHGFSDNQTIIISDTNNFNGDHKIKVRSETTFNIATTDAYATEISGAATLSKVNLRLENGITRIIQGQSIGISNPETDNILSFVGMRSLSETSPSYNIPPTYNTLGGQQNYNGLSDDNLTVRVSKLTAMMADKAQDKTIIKGYSELTLIENVTNGPAQEITFSSEGTPTLNVVLPNTTNDGVITLDGTLSLEQNEAAYFYIDRNYGFNIANLSGLLKAPVKDIPLDENIFIFAIRLSGQEVWLWDGFPVIVGENVTAQGLSEIIRANAYDEPIFIIEGIPSNTNEVQGPVASGSTITLPIDSRDGQQQAYVVGKGVLEVFLNGVYQQFNQDWTEIGAHGDASITFQILQDLVVGDELIVRIDTAGGYVGVNGGVGGGEINTASNIGGEYEVFAQKVGPDLQFRTLSEGVGVNITQTADTLQINATTGSSLNVSTKISTYNVLPTDDVILVDASGGTVTLNLPDATTVNGKVYNFKKIDSSAFQMIIDADGAQTIDDSLTQATSTQYESFTIISDGSAWYIL